MVYILVPSRLEERRVEDFFFNLRMNFKRIADLSSERDLTLAVPRLLKFAEPFSYLTMVRLQQCDSVFRGTILGPATRLPRSSLFRPWHGVTPIKRWRESAPGRGCRLVT